MATTLTSSPVTKPTDVDDETTLAEKGDEIWTHFHNGEFTDAEMSTRHCPAERSPTGAPSQLSLVGGGGAACSAGTVTESIRSGGARAGERACRTSEPGAGCPEPGKPMPNDLFDAALGTSRQRTGASSRGR
jgi:hypothetical protein